MADCEVLDFEIMDDDVICKVILKAHDFRDVLTDLDSTTDFVEFFLSPSEPYFRITTEGIAGKFQVCNNQMTVVVTKNAGTTYHSNYRRSTYQKTAI